MDTEESSMGLPGEGHVIMLQHRLHKNSRFDTERHPRQTSIYGSQSFTCIHHTQNEHWGWYKMRCHDHDFCQITLAASSSYMITLQDDTGPW